MNRKITLIFTLLSFATIFSTLIFSNNSFAQKTPIYAESLSFEQTSIIEFLNNGSEPISHFRLWSGKDFSFISFKSEPGWIGSKTSEGVLVFSSSSLLYPNESVKIGIKTDHKNTGINWKAIGIDSNQIQIGKTSPKSNTALKLSKILEEPKTGILPDSNFKIVPENLRSDSSFRVIGKNFGPEHTMYFFLNDHNLNSFKVTPDGSFVFSNKIPNLFDSGPVKFLIKDQQNNELHVDGFIKASANNEESEEIKFKVNDFDYDFSRGDQIVISGKAIPDIQIMSRIFDPSGNIWTEQTTSSNEVGVWSFSLFVSLESELGEYTVELTDMDETITKNWNLSFSTQMKIDKSKHNFELGESLFFTGTAIPNENLKIFLIDSHGNNIYSVDSIVPSDGFIKIQYQQDSLIVPGTYFLFAFGDNESESVVVGIDENPKNTLSSKMDQTNYRIDDVAKIGIIGKPLQNLDVLIMDSSGNPRFTEKIKLDPDGKLTHSISLEGLLSGHYSLIISKGNEKTDEEFSIGFPLATDFIEHSLVKTLYGSGDSIQISGKTNPNVILDVLLIDPNGNIINKKESFTDSKGHFSINDLRIPFDSISGKWIIRVESGNNFINPFFYVDSKNSFSIDVVPIITASVGAMITIDGEGAIPEQPVEIKIKNLDTEQTWALSVVSTKDGEFSILWLMPDDAKEGDYSVTAKDTSLQLSEDSFQL